jgi:hypothetical protein
MADELLRALGRRQREEPTPVPDETDDRAMQTSRAQDSESPADPMLRAFDGRERAELLDAVFERLDAERASESPEPEDGIEAHAGRVVPLAPRRPATRVALVALAATLAAALLLWLALRSPAPPGDDAIAALPEYVVTQLRGGDATMRSEPSQPPSSIELSPGDAIDWIFTPRSPANGPLGVAVVAMPAAGSPALTRPSDVSISPDGVVRLRGPIDALGPATAGRYTLHVLVGRPDTLPSTPQIAAADGPWSRMTIEVTISTSE